MEDPIAFDLWGAVIPEHKEQAVATIGKLRPDVSRPAILRELIVAPGPDRQVLIARDLAWDTARSLREQLVNHFEHPQVYQTGYGPPNRARLKKCPVHQICYGGVLGCPVCDGWFR